MRRAYLGVLLAVVLPAISVYSQGMRGGAARGIEGGGGHGASMSYHGYYGNGGAVSRSVVGGRAVFARGSGFHGSYQGVYGRGYGRSYFYRHGHGGVVIVYGYGYYPYGYYPYGYEVPVNTSSSAVPYTSDDSYVPAVDSSAADSGRSQGTSEYSDIGASWGQDLRREVVTWDQFVAYLKAYIVTAPAWAQADFREAFINAYRLNGATAYDKAVAEAAGISPAPPPGPKIVTFPPPPPPAAASTPPPAALPPPPLAAAPAPPPAPEPPAPWYMRLWKWL